jgi:hypothetical protein
MEFMVRSTLTVFADVPSESENNIGTYTLSLLRCQSLNRISTGDAQAPFDPDRDDESGMYLPNILSDLRTHSHIYIDLTPIDGV